MKRDVFPTAGAVAPHSTERTSIQHGVFLTRLHRIAVRLELANLEHSARLITLFTIEPKAMRLVGWGQAFGSTRLPALTESPQRLIRPWLRFETLIARAFKIFRFNGTWARVAASLTDICYLPSSHELHGNFLGLRHPFFDGVGESDGVEPKVPRHFLCSKY
jgi:hypothetical protein